jgi:hypothetical protein
LSVKCFSAVSNCSECHGTAKSFSPIIMNIISNQRRNAKKARNRSMLTHCVNRCFGNVSMQSIRTVCIVTHLFLLTKMAESFLCFILEVVEHFLYLPCCLFLLSFLFTSLIPYCFSGTGYLLHSIQGRSLFMQITSISCIKENTRLNDHRPGQAPGLYGNAHKFH